MSTATVTHEEVTQARALMEQAEMQGRPISADEARHCGMVLHALQREAGRWETVARRMAEELALLAVNNEAAQPFFFKLKEIADLARAGGST